MLKSISYISLICLLQFAVSSCHSAHSGNGNTSMHQSDSTINPGHDTIKATVAAKDKNTQTLDDGATMTVGNSISENLSKSDHYSVFTTLLEKSTLYKTLGQKGSLTVFAPSDKAFDKLDKKILNRLMSEAGKDDRDKFLKYHIVGGAMRSAAFTSNEKISTVAGDAISVIVDKGKTILNDENGNKAEITNPDILNNNGILHLMDGVLLPKEMK